MNVCGHSVESEWVQGYLIPKQQVRTMRDSLLGSVDLRTLEEIVKVVKDHHFIN